MFFFFNDTATTEIYTLSLHDALPISVEREHGRDRELLGRFVRVDVPPFDDRRDDEAFDVVAGALLDRAFDRRFRDRKSTRLNSSHANISYAAFCLKKKKLHTTCCASS